jgi:hypothetical protein
MWVKKSFNTDIDRGHYIKEISLNEYADKSISGMKNDSHYIEEYREFVDELSYAGESEEIDFKAALESFERILDFVKNTY